MSNFRKISFQPLATRQHCKIYAITGIACGLTLQTAQRHSELAQDCKNTGKIKQERYTGYPAQMFKYTGMPELLLVTLGNFIGLIVDLEKLRPPAHNRCTIKLSIENLPTNW